MIDSSVSIQAAWPITMEEWASSGYLHNSEFRGSIIIHWAAFVKKVIITRKRIQMERSFLGCQCKETYLPKVR
jgi:hypothetical protein